jgi:hypothetical protein
VGEEEDGQRGEEEVVEREEVHAGRDPPVVPQEAKNWPNIPLQEKFHTAILRGLRNISDTP